MSTEEFDIDFFDDHLLITVGNLLCLIDTGAPSSIGIANVTIAGRNFAINQASFLGKTVEQIRQLINRNIDLLIGLMRSSDV